MDPISRRLMRAYNTLQDRNRWVKNHLTTIKYKYKWFDGEDGDGEVVAHCLLGAMGITDEASRVVPYSSRYFVIQAIKQLFPRYKKCDGPNMPAEFNDRPTTTHKNVLDVLRRAIELSEAHFKKKDDPVIMVVSTKSPWYKAAA